MSAAVATRPRARSVKAAPLELVRPAWDTAAARLQADFTKAIGVLTSVSSHPEAPPCISHLAWMLADELLPGAVKYLAEATVNSDRADEACRMLTTPVYLLDAMTIAADGTQVADKVRDAYFLIDNAQTLLLEAQPWEGAPTSPVATQSRCGLVEIRAQVDSVRDQLDDTRVWLDMMGDQLQFTYADAEQARQAQERLGMLLTSADGQLGVAIELASAAATALKGKADAGKGSGE